MIEKHLIPFFNERATIMEGDVQEFVDRQLEAGHSVKTVKGMVTVLRMIAVYASKQKECLPPVGWQLHYNAGAPCRRTTENVLEPGGAARTHHGDANRRAVRPAVARHQCEARRGGRLQDAEHHLRPLIGERHDEFLCPPRQ